MRRTKQKTERERDKRGPSEVSGIAIYGWHSATAVLNNPNRQVIRILATKNAANRLIASDITTTGMEIVSQKILSKAVGPDAVHQGIAVYCKPLANTTLAAHLAKRSRADCILVLDQITDPHNVGAIIRSAAAFGASAILMTHRHSPNETGVLAKAASGGLEVVDIIRVGNLAQALREIKNFGYTCIGLDSQFSRSIDAVDNPEKLALALGAEGSGLRRLTREMCDSLVHLPTRDPIKSLNVSNAAAVALYALTRKVRSDNERL